MDFQWQVPESLKCPVDSRYLELLCCCLSIRPPPLLGSGRFFKEKNGKFISNCIQPRFEEPRE